MNKEQPSKSNVNVNSLDCHSEEFIKDYVFTIDTFTSPVHHTIEKLEEELSKMSDYIKELEQKSVFSNQEILSMKEKLDKQQFLSKKLESELSKAKKIMNRNHFLINQKKSCSDKEIDIIKEHLEAQVALALDLEAKNKALEEKLREAYIALYYKDTFENKKLREELSDARHALDTTLSLREQIKKRKRRISFFSNPEKLFLSYLKKSLTYLRAIGGIALKSTFIFWPHICHICTLYHYNFIDK